MSRGSGAAKQFRSSMFAVEASVKTCRMELELGLDHFEMLIALKTAGLMVLIAYGSDSVAAIVFGSNRVFFAVLVVPVIEESARYYATGRFCWTAEPKQAAWIGLLLGLAEVGTKSFEATLFASGRLQPLPFLGVTSGSIPIHVALSMAFYAIRHGRWWKMVGLHALVNTTGVMLEIGLVSRVSPWTYVATALAVVTALSFVIGLLSLRKARQRRSGLEAASGHGPMPAV